MTRTVKPLKLKSFLKECGVEGRLLRSVASTVSFRDYFLIKLKNPSLIQRYMIVIRESTLGLVTAKTNIMRYESSLQDCETFFTGKGIDLEIQRTECSVGNQIVKDYIFEDNDFLQDFVDLGLDLVPGKEYEIIVRDSE